MEPSFAIAVFVAVFAIVNPVGNMTVFVALTQGFSHRERLLVIRKTVLSALLVLLIFALVGNYIFFVFGITLPAFRIAGGILLFSIAFSMMKGEKSRTKISPEDQEEALAREALGIVPLGVPLFAGPGAITTVMIYMGAAAHPTFDILKVIVVIVAILLTMALSYPILFYGERIFERIGRMGAFAFSRIMGLILAAIATQFVIDGVLQVAAAL
ncbi:MAG: NAAT family transporter [Candidatus Thermoplasmatota archaeon]